MLRTAKAAWQTGKKMLVCDFCVNSEFENWTKSLRSCPSNPDACQITFSAIWYEPHSFYHHSVTREKYGEI